MVDIRGDNDKEITGNDTKIFDIYIVLIKRTQTLF